MPRRPPLYCCLRKLSADNPKRCKKRIEGTEKKTKVGLFNYAVYFDEYTGDEACKFTSEDFVCQSCNLKIQKLNPEMRNPSKRPHSQVLVTPLKLRNGREVEREEMYTHEFNIAKQGPSIEAAHLALDNALETVPFSDVPHHEVQTENLESGQQFLEKEMSFELEDQNKRAAEEYFYGASDDVMQMEEDSPMMPPPPPVNNDNTVPSFESQLSDFSQNVPFSQMSSDHEVPSEASSSQALSLSSVHSIRLISSPVRRGEVTFVLPGISSVSRSESRCCVCRSQSGRSRIPNSALLDLWVMDGIFIPENNRCCPIHLTSGKFTPEAVGQIRVTKNYAEVNGLQATKWLKDLAKKLSQKWRPISFDLDSGLEEEDYTLLTGIGKEPFQELVDMLKRSNMRESSNRSLRNALGMLLLMLRLNLSQRVIAFMFGISSQSRVSEAIDSVSEVLLEMFVPHHLGYSHLSREQLMEHMRPSFSTVLERSPENMILILDGTYLYVEKSSDHDLQRRSYSSHKHRNLFKPMLVVAPDGYIVEAEGLYYSDGANNDARILREMWKRPESILSILKPHDCLLLDRGFRDVIALVEASNIATFMPQCLSKGQKQFTAEQANASRKVTKLRWIVESANGRLKGVFPFFHETISAGYFKNLNKFLRIAVALQNSFFPPLFTETEEHSRMAEEIAESSENSNPVQDKVMALNLEKKRVCWLAGDEDGCLWFPQLTMNDLEMITLGKYQLKMGALYNIGHQDSRIGYKYFIHRDLPGLLRVKMQSRFSKSQKHQLWIEFAEFENGREAILGYYCKCQSGARTIGCCSHIAAVLRYLGHDRFLESPPQRPDHSSWFMDAAEALAEDSEDEELSSDEEDEREED